jgi:hypothetical protein
MSSKLSEPEAGKILFDLLSGHQRPDDLGDHADEDRIKLRGHRPFRPRVLTPGEEVSLQQGRGRT